jgi:hypothetical protein
VRGVRGVWGVQGVREVRVVLFVRGVWGVWGVRGVWMGGCAYAFDLNLVSTVVTCKTSTDKQNFF